MRKPQGTSDLHPAFWVTLPPASHLLRFWGARDSPPRLCSLQKSITHVFSGQMNQSPAQVQPVEGRKLSLGSLILPVTSEYLG